MKNRIYFSFLIVILIELLNCEFVQSVPHFKGQTPRLQKYGKKYNDACTSHSQCYSPWMHFCMNPPSMNLNAKRCLCPAGYHYMSTYDEKGWKEFICVSNFGKRCALDQADANWLTENYGVEKPTYECLKNAKMKCSPDNIRGYNACLCDKSSGGLKGGATLRRYVHGLFFYVQQRYMEENSGISIENAKNETFDTPCVKECPPSPEEEFPRENNADCVAGPPSWAQNCVKGSDELPEKCEPPLECGEDKRCFCPSPYFWNKLIWVCEIGKSNGTSDGGKHDEIDSHCKLNPEKEYEKCDESLGLVCKAESSLIDFATGSSKEGWGTCQCNDEMRENTNPSTSKERPCLKKFKRRCD